MLLALALFCAAQTAAACPVCFSATNDENRTAFISMTGFLTLSPLALIGAGVWWYRRRAKDCARQAQLARRARRRQGMAKSRPGQMGQIKVRQGHFGVGF